MMLTFRSRKLVAFVALAAGLTTSVAAQEPTTRSASIEEQQAGKAQSLSPEVPSRAEDIFAKAATLLADGGMKWHPFFESAYAGGGFTMGAGYAAHVSPFNVLDVRGSYSVLGYKRAEVAFGAPRLLKRRGQLVAVAGWREATQVGFYGLGTNQSSKDLRTNYSFQQPYGSAVLTVAPTRRLVVVNAGAEFTQWKQGPGQGSFPSVETAYTPEELPGLFSTVTYLHTQGTVALDWRTSPGYSRRGGFYGVTLHDYNDRGRAFGFRQVDYKIVQHFPILREAWVISLRGSATTTQGKGDQEIPFFMLPSLGGGSTLRGYSSWRFRDRHALLLQAEWRIMANRFFESAVFYDAGKVTASSSELGLRGLKSDVGFGVRFHSPFATPLRVELAKGNEEWAFIVASSAAF